MYAQRVGSISALQAEQLGPLVTFTLVKVGLKFETSLSVHLHPLRDNNMEHIFGRWHFFIIYTAAHVFIKNLHI